MSVKLKAKRHLVTRQRFHLTGRGLLVVSCVALLPFVALSACSGRGSSASGVNDSLAHGGHGNDGPVFYYETHTVVDPNARVGWLSNYKAVSSNCNVPPIRLLTPKEELKVGERRTQYWWDGNRRNAKLTEQWGFTFLHNGKATCVFTLTHSAKLEIAYPNDGRIYSLNLVTRKGTLQHLQPFPTIFRPASPPDWNNAKELYNVVKAGESRVAGQPCVVVKSLGSGDSQCVWSAGSQWGYSVMGSNTPILRMKDSDGTTSEIVDKFVLGRLPDQGIFTIPKGIEVVDEGGP